MGETTARQSIDHLPPREGETITELQRVRQHENVLVIARIVRNIDGTERIRAALWIQKASGGLGRWTWTDVWAGTWLAVLPTIEAEARQQLVNRKRKESR